MANSALGTGGNLMQALKTRMHFHQSRQKVLAENVANADSPGFRPMDVKAPAVRAGNGGVGDVSLKFTDDFTLGGIALGTLVTVIVFHLAYWLAPKRLSDAALGSGVLFDAPGSYSAKPLIPPAPKKSDPADRSSDGQS